MSVTSFSTVVGVFNDQAVAEQAVDALTSAGVSSEHMRYLAPGNSGGFFEALKSFFTGEDPNGNPIHDLSHMGLSGSEVQYYSEAYNQGYTILAVNTSDYQGDVRDILHQYGAYTPGFFPVPAGEIAENARQPEDVSTQEAETLENTPIYQSTMDAPMLEMQAVTTPPLDVTPAEANDDEVVETSNADDDTLPDLTPVEVDEVEVIETPDDAADAEVMDVAPAEVDDEVAETSNPEANTAAVDEDETPVEPQVPEQNLASAYHTTAYTAPEQIFEQSGTFQANGVHPQQVYALQQIQNQLQTTRQQLQETKAQLEALKQHESQYTEAQQQLQALQAELQAAQLELQEAKGRVAQYS